MRAGISNTSGGVRQKHNLARDEGVDRFILYMKKKIPGILPQTNAGICGKMMRVKSCVKN
jgi:hypothetical protein